jgi:hypothetical protein
MVTGVLDHEGDPAPAVGGAMEQVAVLVTGAVVLVGREDLMRVPYGLVDLLLSDAVALGVVAVRVVPFEGKLDRRLLDGCSSCHTG